MTALSSHAPDIASGYQIERGVPIPPSQRGNGRVSAYPFRFMEVGDSILLGADQKERDRVCGAAYAYAKKTETKFAQRKTPEGVRVWRTA